MSKTLIFLVCDENEHARRRIADICRSRAKDCFIHSAPDAKIALRVIGHQARIDVIIFGSVQNDEHMTAAIDAAKQKFGMVPRSASHGDPVVRTAQLDAGCTIEAGPVRLPTLLPEWIRSLLKV